MIALCSGRSALGMINAAELLGLPDEGDRIWLVVGNGSTVMTWPPLEAGASDLPTANRLRAVYTNL